MTPEAAFAARAIARDAERRRRRSAGGVTCARSGYRRRVQGPDRGTSERPLRRIAAKAGFFGSAFAVFACGWLATRSDDWTKIILFSLLALASTLLASMFSRTGR